MVASVNITADTPIPLILESLKGNLGWKYLEERILAVRDQYNTLLISKPSSTPPEELQRLIGVMEGLNRILREPELLEREWKAARKKRDDEIEKQRKRAEQYAQAIE